jgi:snRNA-activating protein complex subunit 3
MMIFQKNKRKEVNYITSFPQELGIERSWNGEIIENPEDEVVLSVAIYHPHKHTKMQEFTVLGSQPLTALRDSFYCINDHIGDGSITKSAFFFIENTFYNDMRFPECIDYSQPIIEWVNQNGRYTEPGLGIFASKSMAENTFNDLSIRIGAQYLYCHQGNCEHIIIFTDMRLFHNEDPKNKNLYPIHTFQSRIKRKKCRICDIYSAKYFKYFI